MLKDSLWIMKVVADERCVGQRELLVVWPIEGEEMVATRGETIVDRSIEMFGEFLTGQMIEKMQPIGKRTTGLVDPLTLSGGCLSAIEIDLLSQMKINATLHSLICAVFELQLTFVTLGRRS